MPQPSFQNLSEPVIEKGPPRKWPIIVLLLLGLIAGAWLLFFRSSVVDASKPISFCVDGKQSYTTPVDNFFGESSNYMTTRVVKSFMAAGDFFFVAKVGDTTNVYGATAPGIPTDATKHSLKLGGC